MTSVSAEKVVSNAFCLSLPCFISHQITARLYIEREARQYAELSAVLLEDKVRQATVRRDGGRHIHHSLLSLLTAFPV